MNSRPLASDASTLHKLSYTLISIRPGLFSPAFGFAVCYDRLPARSEVVIDSSGSLRRCQQSSRGESNSRFKVPNPARYHYATARYLLYVLVNVCPVLPGLAYLNRKAPTLSSRSLSLLFARVRLPLEAPGGNRVHKYAYTHGSTHPRGCQNQSSLARRRIMETWMNPLTSRSRLPR